MRCLESLGERPIRTDLVEYALMAALIALGAVVSMNACSRSSGLRLTRITSSQLTAALPHGHVR